MKIRNSPCHGAGGYRGLNARNLTFKKVVKAVMRDRSNNQFMILMENMLRRIVREEFGRLIQPYVSSSWGSMDSETQPSRPRLKLQFINSRLPSSLFTGGKIEAEDGSPVAIELVDVATNARVVSGPLSSSRVEIVPLDGDFTEESWTVEEFKRNILKQREGKRPLLTGDVTVTLNEGVGVIAGDVAFSDNSSWTRSRKFRLGARLTGDGAVEARSEAFGCKDHRGESYKKHHPPYPGDEVWRLEKIAGVSATRLRERGISTVKDFRRWLAMDPATLYSILGGGISRRTWDAIVSHAMDCVLDEKECYIYHANGVSLLFNSVYELIKVSLNGGAFRSLEQLTNYQLDQLKLEAYQNRNSFIAVDARTLTDYPQRSLQDPGFCLAYPGFQQIDFQGSAGPSDSSTSLYFTSACPTVQPEMLMSFENSPTGTFHIDSRFLPSFRVNEHVPVQDELRSVVTTGSMENEEEEVEEAFAHHHHHENPSNWSPGTVHWAEHTLNGMCVSMSGTQEAGMFDFPIANIVGSPRARWCKVKAVFKLREVWRHTTARKRGRGKTCKKPCMQY